MVDAKWRPNNEREIWTRVTAIVIRKISENKNMIIGKRCKKKMHQQQLSNITVGTPSGNGQNIDE